MLHLSPKIGQLEVLVIRQGPESSRTIILKPMPLPI